MTEEIIIENAFHLCQRLEQENKELMEKVKELDKMTGIFSARLCNKYRSALEKIREILNKRCGIISNTKVVGLINEVLDEEMS